MIHYVKGNLFESEAQALVNTVNTVGVMGKGIALQFKNTFPQNFKIYRDACKNNQLQIGKLLITEEKTLLGKKIIINFPTKQHWKSPSEYSYIEDGLVELVKFLNTNNIQSIAIPPLGAGNGGLNWNKVKKILEKNLTDIDCDIFIFEPNFQIQEVMKAERVKLTPARAMLLSVLYELVRNGEFVSEFSAEKIAYFLQRFGAEKEFKLKFEPNFYGPYSRKVKHVLYYLNGSYIKGYSTKDKKPFEELEIIFDAEKEVNQFLSLSENQKYQIIVKKTTEFLTGFYSSFALELLSTVDFIMIKKKTNDSEVIMTELANWSDRKKTLFNNQKFVEITQKHINYYLNENVSK